MAVIKQFGSSCKLVPEPSILDVFQDVERGRSKFGVVPVENSSEGSVNLALDLLITSDLKVSGEIYIKIIHSLISREEDIKDIDCIFSHPQAIAQCRGWIQRNLPAREIIETSSTAEAVKMAGQKKRCAAIGNEIAAHHYGINILVREIQDSPFNSTRFFVLGKEIPERTGRDKTSICFTTPHIPGSLYRALEPFALEGINLTRLESRPTRERPWEYHFFADMEGYITDERLKRAIEELRNRVEFIKVLGSYPMGEREDK
jgi:chorismate mutase/prephenate dehydratase